MLSKFLPETFDPQQPIAVIAGKGTYPELMIDRIRQHGLKVKLIAFDGETSDDLFNEFNENDRAKIKVGQLGHLLKSLKKLGASYAVMAGQITPKRLFKGLKLDLKAAAILATLKRRNAETLFNAIAKEIEKLGIPMLDARAFLDDQLADDGLMVGKLKVDQQFIDHGISIAKEIARLDVGQGVVVRKGTVLAVEAFEGTDNMLKRAGDFEAKDTIFIKTVKPNQDYRFDVPVFGLKTIETMANARIFYAGLEAGNTIILEKDKVLKEAKRHKITLFGYTDND